ncbi:MAG: UDP-N-acetylmuramoyl-L-alanine--D-glutamate ligase [Candidatus Omnitrophica bacterium]|nr:UDP-N-acetylmuramoyl-L-alanine--D-glutamate ligase [Candidatus Omnitrophota bacterium]
MEKKLVLQVRDNFERVRIVGVLGWGLSAQGAAYLARKKLNKKIMISTTQEELSTSEEKLARSLEAEVELGGHRVDFLKKADIWIVSPGVKPHSEALEILRKIKIPWVGEIEFASWFCPAPIIAVTGTNGKTTTVAKISHMFNIAGRKHFLLGNMGSSFAKAIADISPSDWVVLEVSSFQLNYTFTFKPFIACLLNFSPNHLDWHSSIEDYFFAKSKIFINQSESDYALFSSPLADKLEDIYSRCHILEEGSDTSDFVRIVGEALGFSSSVIQKAISTFKNLPHRLEFVRNVKGVNFINDSKSTTPASTVWALQKIEGRVILIAGGQDKGLDYSCLNPYLKKVKKVFLIGSARQKIAGSLSETVDWEYRDSLEEAVDSAYKIAGRGENVLLSPMCASFDSFSNFEERGNVFKRKVYQL